MSGSLRQKVSRKGVLFCMGRWFLMIHALCHAALLAACGAAAALELSGGVAHSGQPQWLVPLGGVLDVVLPVWGLGIGLFTLSLVRSFHRRGRTIYSPEMFCQVVLFLVPYWGLRRYTEEFGLSPREGESASSTTCSAAFSHAFVWRMATDIGAVCWPFLEGALAILFLFEAPLHVSWQDMAKLNSATMTIALDLLHSVVVVLALVVAERRARGWERLGWFALLLAVPPIGVPMLWFLRVRGKTNRQDSRRIADRAA